MDKEKILKFISDGLAPELLAKLNTYRFGDFDSKFQNLIRIMLLLIEKAENNRGTFYHSIKSRVLKGLPHILKSEETVNKFVDILKTDSVPNYVNISTLVREFIISIEDKDIAFNEHETNFDEYQFQKKLKEVNNSFLTKSIEEKLDYEIILSNFYNCVDTLGKERKIFIQDDAIEQFRNYILENPTEYLRYFIRPYYSGPNNTDYEYYLHVPEPFYKQIFKLDSDFDSFLAHSQSVVGSNLITDIESFIEKLDKVDDSREKTVLLFSRKINMDTDRTVKLQYDQHKWIRPECKPNNYS